MAPGCFLDPTVLLCAVSIAPQERATCASRAQPLSDAQARNLIACWCRFVVQPITWEVRQRALDLRELQPLSYWDAAILAASEASGCSLLLSEDLSEGNATARCWCAIRSSPQPCARRAGSAPGGNRRPSTGRDQ